MIKLTHQGGREKTNSPFQCVDVVSPVSPSSALPCACLQAGLFSTRTRRTCNAGGVKRGVADFGEVSQARSSAEAHVFSWKV